MKSNFTRLLLSAVLMMCCMVMNAEIEPSEPQTDGNGNYELSTAAELYWFANYVNSGNTSANAILTEDITVNMGVLDSNGNLNSGTFETWTPIGNSSKLYAGTFNGNGHTISGLYFNDQNQSKIGLFGMTTAGAHIHNLGIKDSYFNGKDHVGGICGDFMNGLIENCWSEVVVYVTTGDGGGLTGSVFTNAVLKDCYTICSVAGSGSRGLVCGALTGKIENCYARRINSTGTENAIGWTSSEGPHTATNVEIKSQDAFASGEVCWLLNNGVTDGSQKWYQTLGTDDVPSLSTLRGTIFKITDDQGECEYANAKCQHEQTYKSYQAAVCPTATTTGRYGHWHCSHCSTDFMDESCTIEATEEELTVPVAKNNEIWYTTTDNKLIENGVNFKTNEYQYDLGKIVLADGVTEIADNAFKGKTTLMSMYIPSSVKKIGKYSFSGCTFLQSVLLSSGLEVIDDNAFDACIGLTSITIPETVTRIGKSVFAVSGSENTSLQTVTIPENSQLEIIDNDAFNRCRVLQSIRIPSSVKKIGNSSFWGCTAMESVIFSSLPDVDQYAFGNCGKLTTKVLDLTDSDKPYIGSSTANYPGFTTANYHGTLTPNTWGTIVLPFIPESTGALEFYRYMAVDAGKVRVSKVQDVQAGVPYLIKNVSESADFTLTAKNPSQIKVTATDQTVQTFTLKGSFKEMALDGTENQNLYCLDDGAFKRIADMQTIAPFRAYIESSESSEVQSMDIELFQHTPTFVNDGYIPTATTTGRYGHWHCSHCSTDFMDESCTIEATEEELAVPVATNKEIWYTTTDNKKLTPNNKDVFGATYDDVNNVYEKGLGKITFDTDVTSIGAEAFDFCTSLQSISIPSGVTSIGAEAFNYCSSLQSISIPSGVTSIGANAFRACRSLQSISIPSDSKLASIGEGAFRYCELLQSINIPSGVTSIGKHAFYDCESLQSINIPSGVTSIGLRAFENCYSLQSITFHSIPNVEEDAFYDSGIKNKTLDLTDSNKPYIGTSLANYPGGFTEANYHLTLAKDSWGTVVLPYVPSSESISNLEFYSYEGVDDGKVFVSKATDIQAGVPYLVKNISEDETTSFTLTATNPTTTLTAGSKSADGFTFKVCFRSSDIAANSNFYYLGGTAFQKATQDNVAPLHAYIVAPEVFEKESMDVVIWNPETAPAPVFVDGVIPTATTTGKYGYWLDESQNKFWNKFCTKPITDDSELTVPVAKDNEIWYTSIDNNLIENKVNCKTNEYQYGLGKIVLADGVIEIADNAFNRNKTIQSIFIPSAVKKIGNSSFWECINLNSVFISEGVTFIDQYAFGKTPIQSILIPSTVQTIATGVFNECTQLQSIVFHSLPKVEYGFLNCNISTKVLDLKEGDNPYIGTSLNNYPSGGFTEAKYALTLAKDSWGTVVLPYVPSSESISNLEFYSYEGVDDGKVFVSKATDIQAGVPYLVKNVSEDETTSFTLTAKNPTITLTAGSTSTDGFTFKGCFRSSDVAANSNLYYLDGTAFQKATQDNVAPLHAYIEASEAFKEESMDVVIWNPTVLIFVDGVIPTTTTTGIYGYWLNKSENKKYWNKLCTKPITDDSELTVPVAKDNEIWYTTINNQKLKPYSTKAFGATYDDVNNVYEKGLGKITFDTDVTSIGYNAFYGCSGLTSIEIGNSVTSIGDYAFYGCSGLTSIEIGNSVTSIGISAFEDCSVLTSIEIPNSVMSIGTSAFEDCSGLTSIEIGNSVTSIGDNAFYGCSGLTSIEIPNSVTSIGSHAFYNCSGLTSIEIGNSVTSIGDHTFYNCSGLTSIEIGNSVTSIGSHAFYHCSGLTSIEIGNSVTSIGEYAFSGCSGLTSIEIPNSVTSIGDHTFYNCSGLTSIEIPNSVTSIGSRAFYNCSGLTSIEIPNSVMSIGISAFEDCSGLTSVIFHSLPDVDNNAFGNCGKLTTKVLDLKDGERPYIGTSLNNYPNGGFTEARFSISLEKNSWETVVLPFVPTNTDGLKFYSCSKVNGMMLEVKETAEILAGVPYLVKNTSDSKTNFTLTATDQISIVLNTSDPESVNGFTLKGTFQTKDLNKDDSKKYYYWNGVGFYQVTAQQTVNPIHAYIETSDMSAVGFIIPTDQEGRIPGILAIDDDYVRLNGSAGSYSLDKLELKYGHSYYCADDFKATNSSYKFYVNPGKWNSWFVPFAVTTGTLEANNLTAAYIAGVRQYEKDAEGNITTLVDIIKIKNARLRAGTPYLVKYDGEDLGDGDVLTLDLGETDFAASSDVHPLNSATTTASYDFIGCYEKAEFDISDKDMYYFMGSNGSLVHSKDSSFSALDWYLKVTPKGDVYDDLSTPSLAKSIIINVIGEEDETTGIRTLYPVKKQVKEVYDLTGRKLSAPKSGQVNIVGGKKLFINK